MNPAEFTVNFFYFFTPVFTHVKKRKASKTDVIHTLGASVINPEISVFSLSKSDCDTKPMYDCCSVSIGGVSVRDSFLKSQFRKHSQGMGIPSTVDTTCALESVQV